MNKKFIFIPVIVIFLSVYFITDNVYIKEEVASKADYKVYTDVEELSKDASLIVEATVTSNTKEFTYLDHGLYPSGHAITEVVVDKVIKDDSGKIKNQDKLPVVELFFTSDQGIVPGKIRYMVDEYTALKPKSKYLLFLSWSDQKQGYWIVAIHQGKINIDGKDEKEKEKEVHLPDYAKLKESVKKKYVRDGK